MKFSCCGHHVHEGKPKRSLKHEWIYVAKFKPSRNFQSRWIIRGPPLYLFLNNNNVMGLYFAKSQLLQNLFSFHWKHYIRCKSRTLVYFLLLLERMSLDSLPYILGFCEKLRGSKRSLCRKMTDIFLKIPWIGVRMKTVI